MTGSRLCWVPLGFRQSLDGQRVRIGSYGRAKHETSAGLPADGRQSTERHFVGAARQVQADDTDATIGGVGDDCIATTDACVDTDVTTTSDACGVHMSTLAMLAWVQQVLPLVMLVWARMWTVIRSFGRLSSTLHHFDWAC